MSDEKLFTISARTKQRWVGRFPTTQGCYPQYLQVASGRQPLLQGSPVIHRSGDSYERESRAVARLALLAVVP